MGTSFGRLFQRRTTRGLVTRHVDLRARGLRLGTSGIRIVLLSDLHAHEQWLPRAEVARVVDAIEAVDDVDLVAIPGDFTGDNPSAIDDAALELGRITSPVVASFGNHDHWAGTEHATRALASIDAHLLTNRALPLAQLIGEARGGADWVAGIDSCWTRRTSGPGANPDDAFADIPADADVVVLGHEPHIATMHQHALHLAGHTHLGQGRSPIFGDWSARLHMPRFSEPYPCRLYELAVEHARHPATHRTDGERRWVYTTGGIGFSTVPFRIFCPPEIVVIDC